MRKYAYLKEPLLVNSKDMIYKIMLHETKGEVYVYQYCSLDAIFCSYDLCYWNVEAALEEWDDLIDERGWIELEEPLPDCQHDAFLPIRVKGRNIGKPEWGKFELLENGIWKEMK